MRRQIIWVSTEDQCDSEDGLFQTLGDVDRQHGYARSCSTDEWISDTAVRVSPLSQAASS